MVLAQYVPTQSSHTALQQLRQLLLFSVACVPALGTARSTFDRHRAHLQKTKQKQERHNNNNSSKEKIRSAAVIVTPHVSCARRGMAAVGGSRQIPARYAGVFSTRPPPPPGRTPSWEKGQDTRVSPEPGSRGQV